jgi:transcriptional regulator with XRE-family HTH domain
MKPQDLSPPDARNELGTRLRALRKAQNLTLAQLAEKSGVSIGTLSKAERGLTALSYDRFTTLAETLGLDVGALFADGARIQPDLVAMARDGQHVAHVTENYDMEMLFPEVYGKTMVPVLSTLRADRPRDLSKYISHVGQEYVYVISGQVVILFERRPPLTLEAGESAYFDSSQGHLYMPGNNRDARFLVVCAGPAGAAREFAKSDIDGPAG